MEQIELVTKELLDTMTKAAQIAMVQSGVEKDSDLIKSVEYEKVGDSFVLLANDYYTYVSTGRKPRARKVPIEDLIKWIKEKRIRPRGRQTISSLAFSIQRSIYISGIKGLKYIPKVADVSLDVAEEGVADIIEQGVDNMLAETFK